MSNAARRFEINEHDRTTLLAYASKYGGGLAQAWREARRDGVLTAELTGRFIDNAASKSDVPSSIKRALSSDLRLIDDLHHGTRRAKLNGPHIDRDPSGMASGDWFQGDDCTLPNLYYEETARGTRLMRGQFLCMIDCRSLYILGWVLISAPEDRPSTYNAWNVRNLITKVHDGYGLPRKGFYFENGTWRAKLLVGDTHDWTETETGLRGLGVRFVHARLPRAKVIERLFGAIQNLTQAEPGYVGRDERHDGYERIQKTKARVEGGHEPGAKSFLDRDEWAARIGELVDKYNAEIQEGKYLDGMSPNEGYERFFGEEPLTFLPENARHLLANERFLVKVGRNGIVLDRRRSKGQSFIYKSELTGRLWGRTVEVFFNFESAEIIGVKDPDTGGIFAVRRATSVPAMADSEDGISLLRQAYSENAEHSAYRLEVYRSVVPKFSEHFKNRKIFRATEIDEATAEDGRIFKETAEAEIQTQRAENRLRKKATRAARDVGISIAGTVDETRAAAAEQLAALLKESKREKSL